MAWSTPSSFSFNQSVTSAQMNTLVDSLLYLRGGDNAVSIPMTSSGLASFSASNSNSAGQSGVYANNDGASNAGFVRCGSANSGYGGANSLNVGTLGAHTLGFVSNNTLQGVLTSGGKFGFGTSSPLGTKLHINDGTFNFAVWSGTGVTTTQVVIADGTNDVTSIFGCLALVRPSSGTFQVQSYVCGTSSTVNIYQSNNVLGPNAGASPGNQYIPTALATELLALSITAGGQVSIARGGSSGSVNYDVALWMMWR